MRPVREHNINRTEPIIEPRPQYPMSTFRNLGGTCPLNSVLICLLATKKLVNFVKDDDSWKNKIRVDLKNIHDKVDKKMKGIDKEVMSDADIEKYITNSVLEHFLCIIKNYFVKPPVLISPIKFCDTIFDKSSIYNDSIPNINGSKRTAIDISGFDSACKGGSGNSLNEYRNLLWNMINETCYHVEDGEFAMKTIYNVIDYAEYEKLSIEEKEKILKKLNILNEIIYVKANILNSDILQFTSVFDGTRKKSSILEMFGVCKKEILKDGCTHNYTNFKVTADLPLYTNLKSTDIVIALKFTTLNSRVCQYCGKSKTVRTVLLKLPDILVLSLMYTQPKNGELKYDNIKNLLYEELDLTDCVEQCEHNYRYKAYAIVQFTIGHFRSFAKYNDTWIVFDDDYVKNLDEISFINEIIRYGIYMLFLERV